METIPEDDIKHFIKSLLAGEIFWTLAIPMTKVSICLFYRRIFGGLKYMRNLTNLLAAFSVGWGVMYFTVLLLQCRPLAAMWDHSITNFYCIDSALFCLIGSGMNMVTDFALVALPLHAVWKLHRPTRDKVQISGILGLGMM
jgi:hypothetical protein